MATLALVDAEILTGPLRMTGRSNQCALDLEAVKLDTTVFGLGGWEQSIAGLKSMMATAQGLYDADAVETGALPFDEELFDQLVAADRLPLTISPTGVDSSLAYISGLRRGTLDLFGQVGEVAPFSTELRGDRQVARGALIHPATVTRTAGGTGTGVDLGEVASGRSLLVAVHVVALSGTTPSLNITVQRDTTGFGSPTTVLTTGALTAVASSLTRVAGPITDDFYRITWTLSGTDPVARFAVAVGIA